MAKTKKTKKLEPVKNKTDIKSNKVKVTTVSEIFNLFALTLSDLPDDVNEELKLLFEDYGSENGDPIKSIRKGIDEWLEGGRV